MAITAPGTTVPTLSHSTPAHSTPATPAAPQRSGFSDVDAASDPDWHVRYLDAAALAPGIAEWKEIARSLLALQPGARLLDAGCGTGADATDLAHDVEPTGSVVGVDLSARMITEAQRRAANDSLPVAFARASLTALPFATAAFDACRAERVLHHLEDPAAALAELVRVTRPGGRVVVMDGDLDTIILDATDRDVTRRIVHFVADCRAQPWGARHLPALFREAGLVAVAAVPHTQVLTRLRYSDVNPDTADAACRVGVITTAEAAHWSADLRARDAAGAFFQTMTLFTVVGTVACPPTSPPSA